MSTEYELTEDISIVEQSDQIRFLNTDTLSMSIPIDTETFRQIIIKQIEILSFIVENPDEVLERFNVVYGQKE